MPSFLTELRRRSVFKVAVAYAIVAWLLMQVADTAAPALNLPEWTISFITLLLILGFPLALFLAWVFELTPEGVKPTVQLEPDVSMSGMTSRKLNYGIVGLLGIALGFVLVDQYILQEELPQVTEQAPQTEVEVTAAGSLPPEVEEPSEVLPNSIAVLPFENLSPDPDNAYFAAGIHDSTLTQLAKINDLNVIARTSVLQFGNNPSSIQDIADALHIELIMEGSVRYANDRVVISAQLIDGRTGAHVWSDEYNRDLADIFAVQGEIAQQIATALEAEILPNERASIDKPSTSSPEAYEAYLRALSLPRVAVYQQTLPTHLAYLDRVIELDPNFALAYAQKALRLARGDKPDSHELALGLAEHALELDPNIGVAYIALGHIHRKYWRVAEAREAYEQAVRLNPSDSEIMMEYSRFLAYAGQYDEAITAGQRALELDPNAPGQYNRLGSMLELSARPEEAMALYQKAIQIDPAYPVSYSNLAALNMAMGNNELALENLLIAEQLWQSPTDWGLVYMAYVNGRLGRQEQARIQTDQLAAMGENQFIAAAKWAIAALAERDSAGALEILEQTATERPRETPDDPGYISMIVRNVLNDPILEQPEFVEVRERLGFRVQ